MVAGDDGEGDVGRRLRPRGHERPLPPRLPQLQQIQIGQAKSVAGDGDERQHGVVAPEQSVGQIQRVGIARAVVKVAAHAHAGLAQAQFVTGDDGDARIALQVAAEHQRHERRRAGGGQPPVDLLPRFVVNRVARQHACRLVDAVRLIAARHAAGNGRQIDDAAARRGQALRMIGRVEDHAHAIVLQQEIAHRPLRLGAGDALDHRRVFEVLDTQAVRRGVTLIAQRRTGSGGQALAVVAAQTALAPAADDDGSSRDDDRRPSGHAPAGERLGLLVMPWCPHPWPAGFAIAL